MVHKRFSFMEDTMKKVNVIIAAGVAASMLLGGCGSGTDKVETSGSVSSAVQAEAEAFSDVSSRESDTLSVLSSESTAESAEVLPERAYKYRLQPLNGTYRDTCDENGYVVDKKDGVVDTILLRDYDDHSCRAVFPMLVVSDPGIDTTSGEDPNDKYWSFTSEENGVTLECMIGSVSSSDLETWKEYTEAYKIGTAASKNPGTYADSSTRYDNIQMSGLIESGDAVFSEWVADERVLATGVQGVFFQLYGSMPVKDSNGNWHDAEIVCMGHADQDDEDAVMAMNETRNELYTALGLTIGD